MTNVRVLRARQLTKLLLNAPLLSLSRLHVTAVMSQAHIVDGMVEYVELVRYSTVLIVAAEPFKKAC